MFLNCNVLYCNRVGCEDGVTFWGGSEAVGPAGSVVARGAQFDEELVTAFMDESSLRRERIFAPMMRDENLGVTMKELKRIEREREY
jgi:predicted amidohydrolase